jgi:hypothetical protein
LIRLDENDEIAAITKLDKLEGETNGSETNGNGNGNGHGSLPEPGLD